MQTRQKTKRSAPPVNDDSLSAMTTGIHMTKGGFLEGLPTVIFQVLQEFLSGNDYLNLMNSNLANFQPIKFETVHYKLIGPNRLSQYQSTSVTLLRIMNRVKNKSNQVSLRIGKVDQALVLKSAPLFEGIHKLIIEGEFNLRFNSMFPFNVFDSVYHLELYCVRGIKTLALNSPRLTKLEIRHCSFQEIPAWNAGNPLDLLVYVFWYTDPVISLPPFVGIADVTINTWSKITPEHFGNNHSITCHNAQMPIPMEIISRPSIFQALTKLTLDCAFRDKIVYDLSFFSKIQFLTIRNFCTTDPRPPGPLFPVFQGQEINLTGFSLSCWNSQMLPDLKKCNLERCHGLVEFPSVPNCRSLTLVGCGDLESLPESTEMILLTYLTVSNCSRFRSLSKYRNLRKASLRDCTLEDFSCFSHVKTLHLEWCHNLKDISVLNEVPKLTIHTCNSLCSPFGIAGRPSGDHPSLEENKRVLRFRFLTSFSNLHHLHHIYQVELESINLISLEGIRDIHHLIVHSTSLQTTRGLGKITGSLTLVGLNALKSVEDVKNIPIVRITYANALNVFEGLGNHHELHINRVPRFEQYLKEYQELKQHSKVFTSIEHLFLKTQQDREVRQVW
jgi:hypothetical protein